MALLDTIRTVETPEGVELSLHLAGPAPRAAAYFIDFLIRAGIYLLISIIAGILGELGLGLWLVTMFMLEWFYPVIYEVTRGATPGKRSLGLVVVHDNGTPIGWRASLLRNLLRAADFVPFCYGLGLSVMLVNKDFKRLGDIAAGTVVVYRPQERKLTRIPPAEAVAPPPLLRTEGMHAVLQFAERHDTLTLARQVELASVLQPVTDQSGERAVRSLLSFANWIARGT